MELWLVKLYALPPSPNTFKVVALAHQLGLNLEVVPMDVTTGANKKPDYLAKNPNGLMPTLEDGDFHLWESNAILMYLAQKKPESGMWPGDAKGQAKVQQWLTWSTAHWGPSMRPFVYERIVKPRFGMGAPDEAELAKAVEPFAKMADVLEGHLKNHKFVGGEQMTIADFAIAAPLVYAEMAQIPLDHYPHIKAYGARITGSEHFAAAIGPMPAAKA